MNEIEKPLKSANMHDVVQEWYAKFVEVSETIALESALCTSVYAVSMSYPTFMNA